MSKEKFSILCIDDQYAFTEWERAIRRNDDYDYEFTNLISGDNIINVISSKHITIAFIDMNLGAGKEFEGINIAKKIRDNFKKIYIALVTSYGKDKDDNTILEIKESLEKKMIDSYIVKEDFVRLNIEIVENAIKSLNNPSTREKNRKKSIDSLKLIKDFKVDNADDLLIGNKLIGNSEAIQDLKKWIVKFAKAQKPLPVLIFGETGTGKELVAQLIHELSNRTRKPFKAVNCAAIPSELIESELFGHEKGAFTSATSWFEGKFEQANGGTLFLDELGEMSLSAQAKILRAIQEKVITRIGGSKEISVDVRIIAATNKDLKTIVQKEMSENTAEKFRHDLFYRISGFHIVLKPLRERKEDIEDLVKHFAHTKTFTPGSLEILKNYDWPGNIRELQSFVESLCYLFHDKLSFDKESVEEALKYWEGQHPNSNYLFSNNNDTINKNENSGKEVKNNIKNYSSYKPGTLDEIEKRFRILAYAMTYDDNDKETRYYETNLNQLAQRGKNINTNDELRNKALQKMENKAKLQKGFTSSGNGITQWFTKVKKDTILKYFAVIEYFTPDLDCLKELAPVKSLYDTSK